MTYKSYTIYVKKELDCPDRCTKEVADKARTKAIEEAKIIFQNSIKDLIKAKDISLQKEQIEPNGVMIAIKTDNLDKVLETLVNLDEVAIIDAEYTYETVQEPKKDKKSDKDKTKK